MRKMEHQEKKPGSDDEGKAAPVPNEKARKARSLVDDVGRLKADAKTREDYELLTRKIRVIEGIFEPKWTLTGTLSEKEHKLAEYEAMGYIYDARFSPDGDKLVVGSGDQMMRLLSLAEFEDGAPKVLAKMDADDSVISVSFSPDGNRVLMGSDDSVVRVLDLEKIKDGEPDILFKLQVDDTRTTDNRGFATNFSPDGNKVVIGAHDSLIVASLAVFEDGDPKIIYRDYDGLHVMAAEFSPCGNRLVMGSANDRKVRVLSTSELDEGKLELLAEYSSNDEVWAATFSPNGDMILTGSGDGLVQLLSLEDVNAGQLNLVSEFEFGGLVEAANFSPEGDKIVVGSSGHMVKVFSLEEYEMDRPKTIAEFDTHAWVSAADFSPQGDKLVVGSSSFIRVLGPKGSL